MRPRQLLTLLALAPGLISSALNAHSSGSPEAVHTGLPVDPFAGPNPWTHLEFRNDPDNFQFAIVADRTGGKRDGVFSSAVDKLNLMQPEFVLSVGDLIEGYTEDRDQLAMEWDEFDERVRHLEMPFFYVAGNHDYSNPVMAEFWEERYGNSYYNFVYRDVLFVILNSNDDGGIHTISQTQLDWFEHVLAEHAYVRWTMVFLHNPFWARENQLLWPGFEAALGDRDYSVFAGHYHNYRKEHRGGHNFYMLATTGGGSSLMGPRFGAFDHITWITMTNDGPRLANLMLDGIWDENVHTREMKEFRDATMSAAHMVFPLMISEDGFTGNTAALNLRNESDIPYTFDVAIRGYSGITREGPLQETIEMAPMQDKTVELVLGNLPEQAHPGLIGHLDWRLETELATGPVSFEGAEPIAAVREHAVPAGSVKVDGDLGDWKDLRFVVDGPAFLRHKAESWSGPDDASFAFDVASDEAALYIAVEVRDEWIFLDAEERTSRQDNVFISLDPRPFAERTVNKKAWGIPAVFRHHFVPAPDGGAISKADSIPEGFMWEICQTEGGYNLEMRFPFTTLEAIGGAPVDGFRLNVGMVDRDTPDGQRAVMLWFPEWRDRDSLPGQGSFRLD